MSTMCQVGLFPNCCNACKFCLREERIPYTKDEILTKIERVKENIKHLDWKDEFSYGISLLGGELYFITDPELQEAFMELIDVIIEYILKVSPNPHCKYSTVTNGIYDPAFLYRVIDRIVSEVGIEKVDVNFSYDLKYRFKKKSDAELVLKNINEFHDRYKYDVGVQMIMTQYVIDLWKKGEFDVNTFVKKNIPGNHLAFLYPHPVHTGYKLRDFNFKRKDFLEYIEYLRKTNPMIYFSFLHSVKNSATFKATMLQDPEADPKTDHPHLTNGKEVLNSKCNHSVLYQCYADSDKCMLCDLLMLDKSAFL